MTHSNDHGATLVATAAALLGLSVLADSAMEHYRGSFHNKAMVLPLVAAGLSIGASALARPRNQSPRSRLLADATHDVAIATGAAGFAFHAWNIGKRPGRLSWLNLLRAAPIGAPFALTLTGLLGRLARRPRSREARTLATVAAVGIAGSAAEAALLHFRGAYQNPAMVLPVLVPPVAAVTLGLAARRPGRRLDDVARLLLKSTAAIGLLGSAFHAYGVARRMGGWANWSQNVLAGPPLPAPPSFTALALAGLAALEQLRGGHGA